MEQKLSEIDRWNHSENYKWAMELNQVLGADNPRAGNQWQETNKILTENNGNGKSNANDHKWKSGTSHIQEEEKEAKEY